MGHNHDVVSSSLAQTTNLDMQDRQDPHIFFMPEPLQYQYSDDRFIKVFYETFYYSVYSIRFICVGIVAGAFYPFDRDT